MMKKLIAILLAVFVLSTAALAVGHRTRRARHLGL